MKEQKREGTVLGNDICLSHDLVDGEEYFRIKAEGKIIVSIIYKDWSYAFSSEEKMQIIYAVMRMYG